MNDPYEILGITRDASDYQIKKAYKNLARQATSLPEPQARMRMDELDKAYDAVISERTGASYNSRQNSSSDYNPYGGSTNRENYGSNGYYSASENNLYDIRSLIAQKRFDDADMLLGGIPESMRGAEWHFLKGQVLYNKGRLENASSEFETAYRMEPSNDEYRTAYENIYSRRSGGYRRASNDKGCSGCDLCSGLICADCCCESMGGDLIPCC